MTTRDNAVPLTVTDRDKDSTWIKSMRSFVSLMVNMIAVLQWLEEEAHLRGALIGGSGQGRA